MYCKYCGKQIADDSTFCQYCGGKLDERTNNGEQSHIEEPVDPKAETNTPAQEVVVTTKEAKPIQVEVSKKSTDNRSTIANEIVGNLKMVGVAFLLFAIHMTVFFMKHQKDIKEYDYPNSSYFGESCYDPSSLSGNWKFNWEEHYYDKLYYICPIAKFELETSEGETLHFFRSHTDIEDSDFILFSERDAELMNKNIFIRLYQKVLNRNYSTDESTDVAYYFIKYPESYEVTIEILDNIFCLLLNMAGKNAINMVIEFPRLLFLKV